MQAGSHRSPLVAAGLMVGGMAIIGVIDNYVSVLAETIGLWQFHAMRSAFIMPLIAGMVALKLGYVRLLRPWAVILRSLLVALAMLCYFSALAFMPIAQALAGLFTSPIFILLISTFVLGQRIGMWRILAVGMGFVGILLVLQPDPHSFDIRILMPVLGGFFYALGAIATQRLCAQESTVSLLAAVMLMLGAMGVLGVIWLAVFPADVAAGAEGFLTRGWVWDMGRALPYVVLQAVGSGTAVFLLTKAYQVGEASYVSVFEYSVMVFGPLFAWAAMGQPLGIWQLLGIALIAGAGIIIALRSH